MKYFSKTHSPLFSMIVVIPMALFYEIFVFINNRSDINGIRNGADILLKRILVKFGFHGFEATILLFLVLFILVSIVHKIHFKHKKLGLEFYPFIIIESIIYSFLLYFITRYVISNVAVLMINSENVQIISYSLGAGVYEELVFRAILLQSFFILFRNNSLDPWVGRIISLILSSLVFAGVHYIGSFGEVFNFITFLARFTGGMLLGILYFFRGFAITSYTHAFYDILLIYV
jgi:membrane protease YdiL (CAAX protease family)